MLGSLVVVGLGFVFTRPLPAMQGTMGMTLFGGGSLIIFTICREGGLDYRSLTPAQRKGMRQHALTSSLMKLGGPLAFAQIGAGPYASITTLGSLLAGAAMTTTMGRWLRVIVILGVLQATNVLTGAGSVSTVGFIAAGAAMTHTWNLPSQIILMGEKRDQCIAQANVICLIFVIPACVPLSYYRRSPIGEWKWGFAEIVAMIMAGILATALAAIMQTRAGRYLEEADIGAWAATAPAVQPVVALVATPAISALAPVAVLVPSAQQWAAFAIVTIAASLAVQADSAAKAVDPIEKEPKRE